MGLSFRQQVSFSFSTEDSGAQTDSHAEEGDTVDTCHHEDDDGFDDFLGEALVVIHCGYSLHWGCRSVNNFCVDFHQEKITWFFQIGTKLAKGSFRKSFSIKDLQKGGPQKNCATWHGICFSAEDSGAQTDSHAEEGDAVDTGHHEDDDGFEDVFEEAVIVVFHCGYSLQQG